MKLEPLEILKTIGVTEVTTNRQRANGTRMFLYPQKRMYNSGHTEPIRFAVYKSGYVRRVTNGNAANYYINTRFKSKQAWYNSLKKDHVLHEVKKPLLILDEQHRLEYLCGYILRNYVRNNKNSLIKEHDVEYIVQSRNGN
jgi:hypothetical protein